MQNLGDLLRRNQRTKVRLIWPLKPMPRRHRPLGWHKAAIAGFRMVCRADEQMRTFIGELAGALRPSEAGCRDA
jgi:hypothetical protein